MNFVAQNGDHYVAIENLKRNVVEYRGLSHKGMILNQQVVLAPNTRYRLFVLQPDNQWAGFEDFVTPASGGFGFGHIQLYPQTGCDTSHSGLTNYSKFIIGLNPYKYSTAGDGISDGFKIAMGLDPFNGHAFPTGVIASLPLKGEAHDVAAVGTPISPLRQIAYVATGSYGLAIVDASQFSNPVVLGQLALPGDAVGVAVDITRQLAVVATRAAGLQLVDVTDPMQPVLRRTIALPLGAGAVKIFDGVAYVSSGRSLISIDLATGETLQTLDLSGG